MSGVAFITRDEARTAREPVKALLQSLRAEMDTLSSAIYDNGNYKADLALEERESLLDQLNKAGRDILVVGRLSQAYTDIIAYRAEAKLDPADRYHPTKWEAWDKQDWKQEKAEKAQAWLAEQRAAVEHAKQVYLVERDHGLELAMLYNLSDGAIDPREVQP